MHTHTRARHSRLQFELLETREVPAGMVAASISGGVLTLTGDDLANSVTIEQTANSVIIRPDATTSVNGMAVNTPVTVMGVSSSLKADLKGGADALAIDAFADLTLPGGASVNLGSGNNSLFLETDGSIQLDSLIVTGGMDNDFVSVKGGLGLGSRVRGAATLTLGTGEADAEFANIGFFGAKGLLINAMGSSSNSDIDGLNLTVAGSLTAVLGGTFGTLSFDSSKLGALSVRAADATVSGIDTTVFGHVNINAKNAVTLMADALAVTESVTLAGKTVTANFIGNSEARAISLRGESASLFAGDAPTDRLSVAGDIRVSGSKLAAVDLSEGSLTARNVTVTSSRGDTFLDLFGNDFNLSGHLSVSGRFTTTVNLDTDDPSEVASFVQVKGGSEADRIVISSNFRARDRVTLKLKNGDNRVTIGDDNGNVEVDGKLGVTTGSGIDTIMLRGLTTGNTAMIRTGSGNDLVSIENDVLFFDRVMLDLSSGDDTLSIAQEAGSLGPVTFNGKSSLKLGSGVDTLRLGKSLAAGGDANSRVEFNAAGTVVDTGTGVDIFVEGDSQVSGVMPINAE